MEARSLQLLRRLRNMLLCQFLQPLPHLHHCQWSWQVWCPLHAAGLHHALHPSSAVEAGGQGEVQHWRWHDGGRWIVLLLHCLCSVPDSCGDQGEGRQCQVKRKKYKYWGKLNSSKLNSNLQTMLTSICTFVNNKIAKGRSQQKKTGIFGNFSQVSDPPSPPFGNPCFQKKKCGLFCILGHLEHFWSSQKCSLFGNYSDIYFWE